jgi:hypothetical protein
MKRSGCEKSCEIEVFGIHNKDRDRWLLVNGEYGAEWKIQTLTKTLA